MKKHLFIILSVLLFLGIASQAEAKKYRYKTYSKNNSLVDKVDLRIKKKSGDTTQIKRKVEGGKYPREEELLVDKNYNTLKVKVKYSETDAEYVCEKKDNTLFIEGIFKGEAFNKTIELDHRPFYYTPKYNLSKFALSPAKEMTFWMLRKDDITKYLMKAKKKGVKVLNINGKEVPAIEVRYSATGLGEKYYKRTYYYRQSDGIFIKKEAPNGEYTVLVN